MNHFQNYESSHVLDALEFEVHQVCTKRSYLATLQKHCNNAINIWKVIDNFKDGSFEQKLWKQEEIFKVHWENEIMKLVVKHFWFDIW